MEWRKKMVKPSPVRKTFTPPILSMLFPDLQKTLYMVYFPADFRFLKTINTLRFFSRRNSRGWQGSVLYYSYERVFEVWTTNSWSQKSSKILFRQMFKTLLKKPMAKTSQRTFASLRTRISQSQERWQSFHNLASKIPRRNLPSLFINRRFTVMSCQAIVGWWNSQVLNNPMQEVSS